MEQPAQAGLPFPVSTWMRLKYSNLDYLEYLYWLNRVYGTDYPGVYRKALPDTLVWRDKLAYNEPLVEYYFRHPAYRNYPVVGVTWVSGQ